MNHRSLAFRLAAWYALILGATFVVVGTVAFYGLENYLRASLRDTIDRRREQVAAILRALPTPSATAIADAVSTHIAPEFNNRFVRVTHQPDGRLYISGPPADHSFDPTAVPEIPAADWPVRNELRTVDAGSSRMLESLIRLDTPSGRYLLETGVSLSASESVQDHLLTLLGWLLPALLACAAGGAYVLVNRALRPVERMSQTAEQISIQEPDSSLPVVPTGDALERLSVSLNHMLARLRSSLNSSRRFLADASHELRTPLTVIKGELTLIAGNDECAEGVRDRIGSVLEEVARLESLVAGLLVLSRLDAGEAQREWLDVDLGELAAATAEQMRLVAEDRGVALHSAANGVTVRGDRGRLKQVIVNLLDNAIKFTPRGGNVWLRTAELGSYGIVEIKDSGIGIPSEALPHVFDRFYRVDEARSREEDGGAGLGLSIVQSICTAHGARIEVESTRGTGSCFRLMFPHAATGATY
jgi:heavy metal sensor kinase